MKPEQLNRKTPFKFYGIPILISQNLQGDFP